MDANRAGTFVTQQPGADGFKAFIPAALPPNPALVFDSELHDLNEAANRAIGRLDGITIVLPNPELFLYSGASFWRLGGLAKVLPSRRRRGCRAGDRHYPYARWPQHLEWPGRARRD
jgi:hypothetical protein